ncbi:MAG: hypothetical protein Q9165_005200 [Trypethelium subeluteriae]
MGTIQSWDYERMSILSSWQKAHNRNGDHACTPSATHDGGLPALRDELLSSNQPSSKHHALGSHSSESHSSKTQLTSQSEWKFDPTRDSFDHSLSDSQCGDAFPDYYAEIDRAAMYYKDRGISEDDMNITERGNVVRAMIYDHQLYIMETHISVQPGIHDLPRMMAILGSINRVIVAHQGYIPDVEFVFSVADAEWNPAPFWTLCRAPEDESHWVMPDFGYWAWDNKIVGSYQQFVLELEDKSDFSKKKEAAFWRGADSNEERHNLLSAAEGHEWSDIEAIIWGRPGNFTRMVDHCDYQYLVQTEGNSYSGRLKYILNCASVVLMRRPHWIESFTHLLQPSGPKQNVIELDDFVELPDAMSYHLSHRKDSENIANNAKELFKERYLTPAAQACYWRKMFEKWAKVQSWDPKPWTIEQRSEGEGKDKKEWEEKVWNGATWELFM